MNAGMKFIVSRLSKAVLLSFRKKPFSYSFSAASYRSFFLIGEGLIAKCVAVLAVGNIGGTEIYR
jgi:hypothetical protein